MSAQMNKTEVSEKEVNPNLLLQYSILCVLALFLVLSPFIPVPEGMGDKGLSTIAIVFLGIALWFTNIVPPAITGIIIVVLFPLFGVLTFNESASNLGRDVIWLIIAMLIMGAAVEKTGLSKRLVYTMFAVVKADMRYISLTLITVAFILTFFVPNAIGRATLLLPIALGIIHALGKEGGPNVGKSCMLIITYVPIICTVALITGATGSIYAASLFESILGFNWSYLYWMVVMLPITIVILLGLWLLIISLFPVNSSDIQGGKAYFKSEKEKLGPLTGPEKKLLLLYVTLISLWITQGIHHMSISMTAVIVVIFLFLPKINIVEWKSTMREVDWGIPLIFSAGLAMAMAFQENGVATWATSAAISYLSDMSAILLASILIFSFVIIRIGFTNLSTMVASIMPVSLTFAMATPFNPVWVGMICMSASSMGFLFPSQSMGTMIAYSMGYYTSQELFKTGLLLTFIAITATFIAAFFYWPLIGLSF